MGNIMDLVDDNTKKEAEKFIERIKSGKIRKIQIYKNKTGKEKFNESRALESFDTLTKSEEYRKVIEDYYK
jgi:ketol-acid reductoisomerase